MSTSPSEIERRETYEARSRAEFDDGRGDRAQLRRIHLLFSTMPAGGLAFFAYPDGDGVLTLEQIADNLDALRGVLNEVFAEHDAEREELGKYRRLMSSLRDVAALFTIETTS